MAVRIEVLELNQRPIQVTDDLNNFWRQVLAESVRRLGGGLDRQEQPADHE